MKKLNGSTYKVPATVTKNATTARKVLKPIMVSPFRATKTKWL